MKRLSLVILLAVASLAAPAAEKRAFTIDDLYRLKGVSGLALSSAGDRLAFEVSSFDDDAPGNALHILAARDGAALFDHEFPPAMSHFRQARAIFLGDNVWVLGVVSFDFGNYKLEPRGDEDIAVNPVGVDDPVATKLGLAQNMPNPFNPKTTIAFTLPAPQDVTIDVFDIAGRKVVTLVDDGLGAGRHLVEWTGRDADGQRVASGVYFYRMRAGEEEFSRKMVLLK